MLWGCFGRHDGVNGFSMCLCEVGSTIVGKVTGDRRSALSSFAKAWDDFASESFYDRPILLCFCESTELLGYVKFTVLFDSSPE